MSRKKHLKTLMESTGLRPEEVTKDYVVFIDDFYCLVYPAKGKSITFYQAWEVAKSHGNPLPIDEVNEILSGNLFGCPKDTEYKCFAFTRKLSESPYFDIYDLTITA